MTLCKVWQFHLHLAPNRPDPWRTASCAPPPTPPSLDMASLSGNSRSKASNWAVLYKGCAEHALYVVFASTSARSPVSASPLRQCPRHLHQRSICSALHRSLDLHRPLATRFAPPQKSAGTSSRGEHVCVCVCVSVCVCVPLFLCNNSRGTKRKGHCCSC